MAVTSPKIVIVNICGALNSGDHTQLVSLLNVVREAHPRAEITCVHRNPDLHARILPEVRWVESLGTTHSMGRLTRRLGNVRGLLPAFLRLPVFLSRAQRITYRALREADLIVACAGGYLGDPGPHVYVALLHMTLSRKGRLFVFPQSVGPMQDALARTATARVLRRAPVLIVREPRSFDYVTRTMGFPDAGVRLLPDMAFYERDSDEPGADAALQALGIQRGEPLAATTLWPSSRLGVPEARYFEILGAAAKTLQREYGLRTIVLRQAGDAEGIEGDGYLLRGAAPFFGEAGVMSYAYLPPAVLRGIVRRCQITYGTRMHGNIFSLAQCVPTVAVSYNHKTNGIMDMCGQGRFVIDLRELQLPALVRLLTTALGERAQIREALRGQMARFQECRQELVKRLRDCPLD